MYIYCHIPSINLNDIVAFSKYYKIIDTFSLFFFLMLNKLHVLCANI